MSTILERPGHFGETQFGGCRLGDRRRQRRLVDVADRILAHPEGSLPHKLQDRAAYRALLRLVNHPKVTHAAVLQPHREATLAEMRRRTHQVTLVIHDTAEADYSGHTTLALGPIGNGHGQGIECHHTLAAEPGPQGRLLGMVHPILHRRRVVPAGEGVAAKRAHPHRESRLWVQAVQAVGPAPDDCLWVDVCDRGADGFEFLEYEVHHGRSFVIRSTHNRSLVVEAEDDGPRLLHDRLRQQAAQLGWTKRLSGQAGQPARLARLQAAAQAVRIQAPHVRRGEHGTQPLTLWAIRVWEMNAPAGVEPLEWILLTNVPMPDAVALRERVAWYERRPLIEEFHKAQKTGVGIEQLQLQSQAGLEPLLALLSVVAVALVNLRVAAHDEATATLPAAEVVDPLWVQVLSIWRYQGERPLTVREFTLALGWLGGHLNRKCDGLPGWQTLWRGWNQLHAMISYELSRQKCGKL